MRPRLLDLFCCAGGAARGYHEAGFEVVGVDIDPQPHYPYEFHQAAALAVLAVLTDGQKWRGFRLEDFDAIHASPPCQASTTMSNRHRGKGGKADSHVNLIAPTQTLLRMTGVPYIIENVPGAKRSLVDPVTLTGGMFGLGVHRPRLFESNIALTTPPKAQPPRPAVGVYGKAPDGRLLWRRSDGSEQHAASSVAEACEAMGIDWPVTWREVAESIPPAYTEHLGRQIIAALVAGVDR